MTGVVFNAVYCSPYRRARETGHLISRKHWAELWDYKSTRAKRDGIELLSEMEERAHSFLLDLKHKHDGQNVLVFAHAGIGLVFRAMVEGRPMSGFLFDYPLLDHGDFIHLRYA